MVSLDVKVSYQTNIVQTKRFTPVIIHVLAVIAPVLYSSWVLGYILNPVVSHSATVSELAAFNQPFRQVFIWGDVLMGCTILFIFIFTRVKRTGHLPGFIGYAMLIFALFSLISALFALPCLPSIVYCGDSLFIHRYSLHNMSGLIAASGLAVAAFTLAYKTTQAKQMFSNQLMALLLVWATLGGATYAVMLTNAVPNTAGAALQRVYLLATAILLYVVLTKRLPLKSK